MDGEPFCPMQYTQESELNMWPANPKNGRETIAAPKVHVNPNFKSAKSLVIHINPRMHKKPMIHVNPKMMKDILPVKKSEIPEDIALLKTKGNSHEIQLSDETPIQKSIHVNPKLMEKLSSIARADIEATTKNSPIALVVPSKTNENEVCDNKISRKSLTSQPLLTISRRKLVRLGANSKTTDNVKSAKIFNATTIIAKTKKSVNPNISLKLAVNKNKHKLTTYKIDRTKVERNKRKKVTLPDVVIRNVNKGLVAIGGVMYQSSRTRLVRSSTGSPVHKKRKSIGNTKGDTFVMAKNGKKLHRLSSSGKDVSKVSPYAMSQTSPIRSNVVKRLPSSIVHWSHKNVISYKAKQRSLQILRDKLRKNYIPCLIFRRFGYCANHAKGTCAKLHDKKQVALCRNFLQGKCLLDECPMSHNIGPEKMPTCKYFLEGCCIRDACPYLHVKVSPNTPLCAQFLRGYCAEGSKCKQRHAYICPEFEKAEKCSKGKHCPYPHKLKSAAVAASVSKVSVTKNTRTRSTCKQQQINRVSTRIVDSGEDNRKRYYDKACPSDEMLAEMRENILKQMKLMKATLGTSESVDCSGSETDAIVCLDTETMHVDESDSKNAERPKRPPIGPLPAYIPIN